MLTKAFFRSWGVCFVTVSLMMGVLTGCGSPPTVDLASVRHIDITGDYDETALLDQLARGTIMKEPLVVKVPAGFPLPVAFKLKSPLAEMNSDCSTLHFRRDLYVYLSSNEILLSPDLKQWAHFNDMESVKELFGGGKGELAVQMSTSKENGARIEIDMTIYPQ